MKAIHSITVTAVVLLFALSAFAGTAAAEHDSNDIESDGEKLVPGGGVAYDAPSEDRFLKAKKAFDGHENFPDTLFDGDGDQVEDGPEIQG